MEATDLRVIYVRNTTRKHAIAPGRIKRTARKLLSALDRPDASLSVTLVGNAAMRRLNREHRGRDGATDVLSFAQYRPFRVPPNPRRGDPEVLLGDIVVSLDVAQHQARSYGASLEAEIDRLLVHGLAHLMGHDHERAQERSRMLKTEKRLCAKINLPWPYGA